MRVSPQQPLLRGRLSEADQLRTRLGLALPVEVRYDDYTTEIPENQILLSAVRRLYRLPGVPPATRRALHRIAPTLADVTPLTAGARVPATPANRLTDRYEPALRLARLILAGASIEHPPGSIDATGFAFDLNTVLEDWLTTPYGRLSRPGTAERVTGQHQMHLDEEGQLPLVRPDITWWDGHHCLAVIDAKYKAPGRTPPRDDIYQMLAYCSALKLRRGHLVYGSAGPAPVEYLLTGNGVKVSVHGLDLSAPLTAVRQQITRVADAIATWATSVPLASTAPPSVAEPSVDRTG